MAIGWIVGTILLAAFVSAVALLSVNFFKGYGLYDIKESNSYYGKGAMWAIIAFVLLMVFILVPFSFHTVDATEVGVVKELGKLVDVIISE